MNNEEKILALLEEHGTLLREQGLLLEKQGAQLERQGALLEKHDKLISEMRADLTKVMVTQENVVIPQLKTLAEGHMTLLETLAPKSRVEALEEDVSVLKVAVKALTAEMAELKKAQ